MFGMWGGRLENGVEDERNGDDDDDDDDDDLFIYENESQERDN